MQVHNESEAVELTLLIAGGHKQTIHVPEGSSLLSALIGSVIASGQAKSDGAVFNIPLSNHQGSLLVPGSQIYGLVTNRPLLLEPPPVEETASRIPHVKNMRWSIVQDFLETREIEQLLDLAASAEPKFAPSTKSSGDPQDGKSVLLPDFNHPLKPIIETKVRKLAEENSEQLLGRKCEIRSITSQLTAHKDGDYLRIHQDKLKNIYSDRAITFIYYFFREPKRFEGGELLLFDTIQDSLGERSGPVALEYRPLLNSLILFPSDAYYEVAGIRCSSQAFLDNQFTVDGWMSD